MKRVRDKRLVAGACLAIGWVLLAACVGEDPDALPLGTDASTPEAATTIDATTTTTDATITTDATTTDATTTIDASTTDTGVADAAADADVEAGVDGGPTPTGGLVWAKAIATTGIDDEGTIGTAVDPQGNLYVVGQIGGPLNLGGACNVASTQGQDGYLAKLDASGTCLAIRLFASSGDDFVTAVAYDANTNRVVVAGWTTGATLTVGATPATGMGATFAARLSSDLSVVDFANRFGTTLTDTSNDPHAIAINPASGRIGIVGTFAQPPTNTPGPTTIHLPGGSGTGTTTGLGGPYAPYFVQLNTNGSFHTGRFMASTTATLGCVLRPQSLAYDERGDAYVGISSFAGATGCSFTDNVPTAGAPVSWFSSTGESLGIIAKFQASQLLERQSTFSIPKMLDVMGLAYQAGRVYAAMRYSSVLSTPFGPLTIPPSEGPDALVLGFTRSSDKLTLVPEGFLVAGSPTEDRPLGLAIDPWGNVVVVGSTGGVMTLGGLVTPTLTSASAGFAAKCSPALDRCFWAKTYNGARALSSVAVGSSGRIVARGAFTSTVAISPGLNFNVAGGGVDGFAVTLEP